MKTYSNYYIGMMLTALISAVLACIIPSFTGAVILFVIAFITWYAAIMAPNHEKYTIRKKRTYILHGSDKDAIVRNLFTPKSDIEKLHKHIELTHEFCETMQESYTVLASLRTKYIGREEYHLVNILQDEMDRMLAEVDNQAIESYEH